MKTISIGCGLVNNEHLNKNILVNGWVKKNRKLGNLIFLEVYDVTGFIQVVVEISNPYYQDILKTTKESTVRIEGKLVKRKAANSEIKTGEYEILLNDFLVYSPAKTPPFLIQDNTDALEETRLNHRYLDLRRPLMQQKIIFRSKVNQTIRNFLTSQDFIEIETPLLSRQTPEGARDYLVPTRNGTFFALPQSPQIYKQLLMVGGFQKYFQIVRCFRDEDLRSDRQPEFTQLDIETSFLTREDIMSYCEKLFQEIFSVNMGIKLKAPFIHMSYDDAINFYGVDKPDLRFDIKLTDVSKAFSTTKNNIFSSCLKNEGVIKALFLDEIIAEKKDLKALEKFAQDNKAKGIFYAFLNKDKTIEQKSKDFVEDEIIKKLFEGEQISYGTAIFIADNTDITNKSLGAIRTQLPRFFDLKFKSEYAFVWIVDWPLFEYSDTENRFLSAHHPFTAPTKETEMFLSTGELSEVKAQAYDLVLNGFEIGGGSIRIYDQDLQGLVFKSLGLTEKETKDKFGFLFDAFNYGVPPHGGIAFGLDRVMMILTKSQTIRDVIAFPKNSIGSDQMLLAPNEVDEKSLAELKIKKIQF